ncbi:hypothetical protein LOC51_21295 [Rubrivivax sp. JA1024]|nr:hypothetical protein [Rubrivivax sp. JA1024]
MVQFIGAIFGAELPEVPVHSLSFRVKTREGCLEKFDRKYRDALEEGGGKYSIIDRISDLIGIRVVLYYQSDIDLVAQVLTRELEKISETDKIKSLDQLDGVFGYRARHFDVRLNEDRRHKSEYRRYSDLQFEVQVRTVVQDAWSVLDHQIKYKKNIPISMKRRISMLAALFELADYEFQALRDESNVLVRSVSEAVLSQVVSSPAERLRFDVFGLQRLLARELGASKSKPEALDEFLAQTKVLRNDLSESEFSQALRHVSRVRDYARDEVIKMTEVTLLRHCFFLEDPAVFGRLLFREHRERFETWLSRQSVEGPEK